MVVGVMTQEWIEMPVAVIEDSRAPAYVLALNSASATVARSDERPESRCAMIWTTPKSAGCIVFAKNAEKAVKSAVID
jgi:hypothetical protein